MRRLAILIAFACAGCTQHVAPYSDANAPGLYTQGALNRSKTIEDIRAQLPMQIAAVQDLPSGNKLWTFATSGSTALPLPNGGGGVQWMAVPQSCTVQMEATPAGMLVRGSFQGNGCP